MINCACVFCGKETLPIIENISQTRCKFHSSESISNIDVLFRGSKVYEIWLNRNSPIEKEYKFSFNEILGAFNITECSLYRKVGIYNIFSCNYIPDINPENAHIFLNKILKLKSFL